MKMKKLLSVLTVAALAVGFTSCGGGAKNEAAPAAKSENKEAAGEASFDKDILVVSREDGSGTRSAFVELTGVLTKDGDKETDNTISTAQISPSTNEVMTFVSNTDAAIGYISLGSLNDTVKALKVEGVEATPENIKAGSYKISRPFNICYKDSLSNEAKDFISFIKAKQGQDLAAKEGYIAIDDAAAEYKADSQLKGKVTIQGSTSVAPLMEKIMEAYKAVQPDVTVEIQANGSSAGVKAAMEGQADIGMASRELKDEEKAKVTGEAIAQDGIAVIINKENPAEDITIDQLKGIYTGEIANWSDIK